MKTLKEVFVIVEQYSFSESDFFHDYVSFEKSELDLKCEALNKEKNDEFEKKQRKNGKLAYRPMTFFIVLTLSEAIEKFGNIVADNYMVHDASY